MPVGRLNPVDLQARMESLCEALVLLIGDQAPILALHTHDLDVETLC